jgi:hypothetical protein
MDTRALTGFNELSDFPLADDGVVDVQPSVLPLHWAIDVQGIAEPVVG